MLRKAGTQYLVQTKNILKIFANMKGVGKPLMVNRLVKRVVCKKNSDAKDWIRIMEGDIEYLGDTQRCTMAYITESNKKKKDTLVLNVDNFEDAIHFAEEMGFIEKSYQEHLRSKFTYELDDVTYVIRFDVWAQTSEYTVIEVGLFSSGQLNLKRILNNLKIMDYAGEIKNKTFKNFIGEEREKKLNEKSLVDIQELYKELHGKIASEIPYITFNSKVFNFSKTIKT